MASTPNLSVVLPVFNEEHNIPELHRRLLAALHALALSYEVIYVDDGSSDRSRGLLSELAQKDSRVGVLILSRNFGHQVALSAGLDYARGDGVILMDSDLQDPPELIPELVGRWKEGFDVVYAQRKTRKGESIFKRASAYLFYRLVRLIASIE
jgi:dolichol-phosphate mannosyltransferase